MAYYETIKRCPYCNQPKPYQEEDMYRMPQPLEAMACRAQEGVQLSKGPISQRSQMEQQDGRDQWGRDRMQPMPTPYYQMFGQPMSHMEEQEREQDLQRLKEMYPDTARMLLDEVEEECDKMEYEGSIMFDEQPDRVMFMKICNGIYDRVKDGFDLPEDEDRDDMMVMNRETRRRYPPRKNWVGDLIQVLMLQEMHHRRCRHRNCRRWY